jgi:hypothetical protein
MHWAIGIGIVSLCFSSLELWMIHYDQPGQQLRHEPVEPDAASRRWLP